MLSGGFIRPNRPQMGEPGQDETIMIKAFATMAMGGLLLTACATPATRISDGLQRYGLDAERADCVGTRLQHDLSFGQLQQLGRAAAAYRRGEPTPGVLTVDDLLRVAGTFKDAAVPLAVGKAAAQCGILS